MLKDSFDCRSAVVSVTAEKSVLIKSLTQEFLRMFGGTTENNKVMCMGFDNSWNVLSNM
jgi:hypothetical protein